MSTFSKEIDIEADIADVWAVLADIGNIADWNPGVQKSNVIGERPNGLGAQRLCNLGGKNYLKEDVVQWVDQDKLTMRIVETNLPFKSADIHFVLSKVDGGTQVRVTPDYELKFGVLGNVLDTLFINRVYQKGMGDLLAGLKEYVESK